MQMAQSLFWRESERNKEEQESKDGRKTGSAPVQLRQAKVTTNYSMDVQSWP